MKFKLKSLLSNAQAFRAFYAEREQNGKLFELVLPANSELIISDNELSKLNHIKMFESLLAKGNLILERIDDVVLHEQALVDDISEEFGETLHEEIFEKLEDEELEDSKPKKRKGK